jgi:hypothetical protein
MVGMSTINSQRQKKAEMIERIERIEEGKQEGKWM